MPEETMNRRRLLAAAVGTGTGLNSTARAQERFPIRRLTQGPAHHWFGYYDKLQFDPTSRYVLGMEVGFEHRSPKPEDSIRIGRVDLQSKDRWETLGQSRAWCWQQGCMLQWIPRSSTRVIWNDREDGQYVSRILDTRTGKTRTIGSAIYALSPDGRSAVTTDFRRLADTRPGYGYNGVPDPYRDELRPDRSGIWRVDLETGKSELILTVRQIASLGPQLPSMDGVKHWFNHLLFNPDGSRFVFLHRWQVGRSRETRMVTAAPDGTDIRMVDYNGLTSHFIWRDRNHILAWSGHPSQGKAFYLFEDGGMKTVEAVGKGVMTDDGHCTYLAGGRFVLCDTYPDSRRMQKPYLYELKTRRRIELGEFLSPAEYTGEWRCDTHPRSSPDGKYVVIDSPTADAGRQLHLIDVSGVNR